jgi:hypothetical protein
VRATTDFVIIIKKNISHMVNIPIAAIKCLSGYNFKTSGPKIQNSAKKLLKFFLELNLVKLKCFLFPFTPIIRLNDLLQNTRYEYLVSCNWTVMNVFGFYKMKQRKQTSMLYPVCLILRAFLVSMFFFSS